MMEMHWIQDSTGRLTIVWKPAQTHEVRPEVVLASPEKAMAHAVVTAAALETQRAA